MKEKQFYVCKMKDAKDGLGIVSVDYYETHKFKSEITHEGSFDDCVLDKKIQIKNK